MSEAPHVGEGRSHPNNLARTQHKPLEAPHVSEGRSHPNNLSGLGETLPTDIWSLANRFSYDMS